MHSIPSSEPLLSAFMLASFALAITPGPGVFYIVTRSVAQGRRAGIASVAGVALGNFTNAVGASVGLAALFAVSAFAFSIVKYGGAFYLVFLGIRALSRPAAPCEPAAPARPNSGVRILRAGFVVALLNPKTAMFFAAFLPQFLSTTAPPVLPSIALSALFVAIAAITDTAYALTAGTIAPMLFRAQGAQSFGRYLSASALISLGAFNALAGARHGK
jgi:threonine/homoserine/homoserine lactone efflux protein